MLGCAMVAFHQLIKFSSVTLKKIMKIIVGIMLTKRTFVGKGIAKIKNRLK